MKLTIGIKALNEERHIEASLKSAIEAARPWGGEVILADSGSTDRTIEIARQYPVKIVQLAKPDERSCGAGAQLAFQHAAGEYFYLLDGDMVLDPGFMAAAIACLDNRPELAAVGGLVREMVTDGEGFQIRATTVKTDRNWLPGEVNRLDCGGLYRTSAVRGVGYFADRNLHAFEELELAARLQSQKWKLARIDQNAVDHYGHAVGGYRLLSRRMRSGYSGAPGEVLRGAIGRPHLPIVLRNLGHLRNGAAVLVWWLLLVAAWLLPVSLGVKAGVFAALLLGPLALLVIRRRSLRLGAYSMAAWNVSALGLITGFFRRRAKPTQPITANVIASDASTAQLLSQRASNA